MEMDFADEGDAGIISDILPVDGLIITQNLNYS